MRSATATAAVISSLGVGGAFGSSFSAGAVPGSCSGAVTAAVLRLLSDEPAGPPQPQPQQPGAWTSPLESELPVPSRRAAIPPPSAAESARREASAAEAEYTNFVPVPLAELPVGAAAVAEALEVAEELSVDPGGVAASAAAAASAIAAAAAESSGDIPVMRMLGGEAVAAAATATPTALAPRPPLPHNAAASSQRKLLTQMAMGSRPATTNGGVSGGPTAEQLGAAAGADVSGGGGGGSRGGGGDSVSLASFTMPQLPSSILGDPTLLLTGSGQLNLRPQQLQHRGHSISGGPMAGQAGGASSSGESAKGWL